MSSVPPLLSFLLMIAAVAFTAINIEFLQAENRLPKKRLS
jgi:hypothetical protein